MRIRQAGTGGRCNVTCSAFCQFDGRFEVIHASSSEVYSTDYMIDGVKGSDENIDNWKVNESRIAKTSPNWYGKFVIAAQFVIPFLKEAWSDFGFAKLVGQVCLLNNAFQCTECSPRTLQGEITSDLLSEVWVPTCLDYFVSRIWLSEVDTCVMKIVHYCRLCHLIQSIIYHHSEITNHA